MVCGKFYDKYIIVYRFGNKGAMISESLFGVLTKLSVENADVPEQLAIFLGRIGFSGNLPQKVNDLLQIMPQGELNFGSASYEITERCNYRCKHCVLGERKVTKELSVTEKKSLIKTIRVAGCIYLQITGGEPLLASGFEDAYYFAYSLGMLVKIQTNGSLLSVRKNQKILENWPPYKIVVSIYGGTKESYQNLTRTPNSFSLFLEAMEWLKKSGISVRANIIVTRYNEHEVGRMVNMAEEAGFEYFAYTKLTPTFEGNPAPMNLMARDCATLEEIDAYNPKSIPRTTKDSRYGGCLAGKAFFHVTHKGEVMICQSARDKRSDLLKEGISGLARLSKLSEKLLTRPSKCNTCEYKEECPTCPPNLEFFRKADNVPSYICKKLGL